MDLLSWFGGSSTSSSVPPTPTATSSMFGGRDALLTSGGGGAGPNTASNGGDTTGPSRQPVFRLSEQELYRFLVGAWKRNLEWREFGNDCQHLRQTNTIVMIEEHQKLDNELGARHLKWSFGRTLQRNELRGGYIMKCTNIPKTGEVQLDWQYSGVPCTGKFFPSMSVMILNFLLRTSTVVATYRILDADTMAVCVVEVDDKEPSISFGNMYRIDQSAYQAPIYQQGPSHAS